MTYRAVTSYDPPDALGASKKLYSPDLLDTVTGAYPISPIPSVVTYPAVSGRIPFYESSQVDTGGSGYIQVTLSGAGGGGDYWDGWANVLNAADRSFVTSVYVKGSKAYHFVPANLPTFYLADCFEQIEYTDATYQGPGWNSDGGDQKTDSIPAGDYIVQFASYTEYTETAAMQHPPAGFNHGIAAAFSTDVTTTISVMEVNVTVVDTETVVAALSL